MTDLDEYLDVREIHPEYTTLPCIECSEEFYVTERFAYTHEEWYCDSCLPDSLRHIRSELSMGTKVDTP